MGKLSTLRRILRKDKGQIITAVYNNIVHTGITNILPDKLYLQLTCYIRFGKRIDLKHPRLFSEKIQWLKLNDRKDIYVEMVDKVLAKEYVKNKIGEEYIVPTYGVWDRFEDIDFDKLPQSFVLKCNHDSGSVIICKDKGSFDYAKAKKTICKGLKTNAFFWGREWPYKKIQRRVLAEEYLSENIDEEIRDFKFFCFNGVPHFCQVISNRTTNEQIDFFDMQWQHQPFVGLTPMVENTKAPVSKPICFEKMKEFAKVLSDGIPFVRIDFYEVAGKLYFGEITFYPASGYGRFYPDEWNEKLGRLIQLR